MSRSRQRKASGRRPQRSSAAGSNVASSSVTSRWRSPRGIAELLVWGLWSITWVLVFSSSKDAFRLPKQVFAEPLVLLSIAALALRLPASVDGTGILAWGRRQVRRPAVLAVLPLVVVASCGLWTSAHPERVERSLPSLLLGAAALVAWSGGLERTRLAALLRGLAVPAVGLSLVALAQVTGLWRPFTFADGAETLRLGVTSLAGSAGDLGVFLVLPLLIALHRVAAVDGRRRWLWGGVLALSTAALVATQTLTALLAAAFGAVVLAVHGLWGRVADGRISRRRLIAVGTATVVVLGALVVFVQPLAQRIGGKARQVAAGEWDEVLTGRLDGWKAAVHLSAEHPLTGVGLGAYGAEFAPAKLKLMDEGVAFYRFNPQVMFVNAHNEYLEVLAELGLPGLLALLWGVGILALALRSHRWRADSDEVGALSLARAGVAALAVLAIAQFPFRLALTAWPAVLFLAWVLAPREISAVDTAASAVDELPASTGASRPLGARLAALALALALATGAVVHFQRGYERLTASRILLAVEVTSRALLSSGQASRSMLARVRGEIEKAEVMDPLEFALPMARGSLHLVQGQGRAAEAAYRQALVVEPRPELYLNLGKALRVAGDEEGAQDALSKAVRLDPRLEDQLPPPAP